MLTHTRAYLVERCQVMPGLDEKGLVDSRMVHVMGGSCHQTQEYIQRTQLLCQLQHTNIHKVTNVAYIQNDGRLDVLLNEVSLINQTAKYTNEYPEFIVYILTSAKFHHYCHNSVSMICAYCTVLTNT